MAATGTRPLSSKRIRLILDAVEEVVDSYEVSPWNRAQFKKDLADSVIEAARKDLKGGS